MREMQNWNPVMSWAEREGYSASSFMLDTEGDYGHAPDPESPYPHTKKITGTTRPASRNTSAMARRKQTQTVMSKAAGKGFGLG